MKEKIVKAIIGTTDKLFAEVVLEPVTACKPCHCAACGELIPRGVMRAKVRTRRQPVGTSYCLTCWNKVGGLRANNMVTGKAHNETWYNISDNHNFRVCVTHNSEEVKGYLLTHGWTVYGVKDCSYYPMRATFEDNSHHAITKFLDELFTSGYEMTVTVNGVKVENTEECRDVLQMKVRNAVLNKSIKK